MEAAIPPGEMRNAPLAGQVLRTQRFLELLGFRPKITNLYPGLGRQWITCRGELGDPDYVEKDSFSSFAARELPTEADGRPRSGDIVFRLPEPDPIATLHRLRAEDLVSPYLDSPGSFVVGPDLAIYELARATADHAENRTISIWTSHADVAQVAADYETWFACTTLAKDAPVEGLPCARATVLRRDGEGAVTIRLLTLADGRDVAPRIVGPDADTDPGRDIFTQAGYGHFRLGARDRDAVRAVSRKVFDDTGDVAYALFHHAYLELVELAAEPCSPEHRPAPSQRDSLINDPRSNP
jgi:hypothetical protein